VSKVKDALDRHSASERRREILVVVAAVLVAGLLSFPLYGGISATAKLSYLEGKVVRTVMVEGQYGPSVVFDAELEGTVRKFRGPGTLYMLSNGDPICVKRADIIFGITRYSYASDIYCPRIRR
jgi:hypothetical protein